MGYFSNGTSADMYEEQYCEKCIHGDWSRDPDTESLEYCPIWRLHLLYNYNRPDKIEEILDMFIPQDGKGFNKQCLMFRVTT